MGIPCRLRIDEEQLGFVCRRCQTHLARASDAIKGEFRGQLGAAVFMGGVINVDCEQRQVQKMSSGDYVVRYVHCRFCGEYLGWTYVLSYNLEFKYKEGKFCLEEKNIVHVARQRRPYARVATA